MDEQQLDFSIEEIYRIAKDYQSDVEPYILRTPEQVFNFVARLPYVPDSKSGFVELFKRPLATIQQGGDCDDKTILAGTFFNVLNIPWRIVTVSTRPDGEFNHVYLEVFTCSQWLPFDATYPTNTIFAEPSFTRKRSWDLPVNYHNKSFGIVTLEGLGDTPSPWANYFKPIADANSGVLKGQTFDSIVKNGLGIASASAGTSVAGAVGAASLAVPIAAVGTGLVALFLSIFKIKGPTPHMTTADAGATAANITNAFVNAVKNMPADGQQFAINICNAFQVKMTSNLATGWITMDNDTPDRTAFMGSTYQPGVSYLNRYYAGHTNNGDLTGKNGWIAQMTAQIFGPAYVVARSIDASDQAHWTNEFTLYFANYFQTLVLNPMQSYLGNQFTSLVNQLHAAAGTNPTQPVQQTVPNPTPAAAATDNTGFLILAAGAALLFA